MSGSAFNPGQWGRKLAAGIALAFVASGGIWWATGQGSPPATKCYIASPSAGATLTGTVTVKATCTSSVTSLQVQVDGATIGTSQTVSWNSASVLDGSHSFTVVAAAPPGDPVASAAVTATTSNSTAANYYVAATGSDSNAGTSPAAPFLTLNKALTVCSSGTITMAAGTYAAQTITATSSCTVQAAGATTSKITLDGGSYTIDGLTVDTGTAHGATAVQYGGSNVTMNTLDVHGSYSTVSVTAGTGLTWNGGEEGCYGCAPGARNCNDLDSEPVNVWSTSYLTIEHVTFWPQKADSTPCSGSSNGFHLEMIRTDYDASHISFTNDTFNPQGGGGDNTGTLFFTRIVGSDPADSPNNVLIENDFFGSDINPPIAVNSAVATCVNYTVAYNTFLDGTGEILCTTDTNVVWVGNIASRASYLGCDGTHIKNIWEDDRTYSCGSDTVLVGTRGGLDKLKLGGTDGFYPQTGSPVIDGGENTYCPATDHDGNTRPDAASTPCDAGAIESAAGS